MALNWYLLKTTGSTSRVNTYVRKFTEGSERSGVMNMTSKVQKKTGATIKITELDNMSYMSSSSRKSNRSGQLKVSMNGQNVDVVCPMQPSSKPIEKPVVRDSPQMREFFEEVRQRKLKDYYLQMKAAQRSPTEFGPVKRDKKDLTKNVYCTGHKRLRIQDCDRHRDLTWLWNSSAACPHSALSCGCSSGVSSHLETLFKLHNIKCLI
ncbi:uncharacterized protein LOC6548657 [Drosophila erecta]|uniref:Uncharacterized protein n=1 Tax=Drosophila erecta TaxID=7220 RepID=B3NPL2_DROER|nr:uncharacterized protein LOC6548657 [Drosophila erecta]EDV55779.1 uncharacterized protein Dere_GG22279 [Drosophila erecta]